MRDVVIRNDAGPDRYRALENQLPAIYRRIDRKIDRIEKVAETIAKQAGSEPPPFSIGDNVVGRKLFPRFNGIVLGVWKSKIDHNWTVKAAEFSPDINPHPSAVCPLRCLPSSSGGHTYVSVSRNTRWRKVEPPADQVTDPSELVRDRASFLLEWCPKKPRTFLDKSEPPAIKSGCFATWCKTGECTNNYKKVMSVISNLFLAAVVVKYSLACVHFVQDVFEDLYKTMNLDDSAYLAWEEEWLSESEDRFEEAVETMKCCILFWLPLQLKYRHLNKWEEMTNQLNEEFRHSQFRNAK